LLQTKYLLEACNGSLPWKPAMEACNGCLQQHMQLHWSNLALIDAHTVLALLLIQLQCVAVSSVTISLLVSMCELCHGRQSLA